MDLSPFSRTAKCIFFRSKINVIEHYIPPKRYLCHCLCLLGKTWLLLYIIDLFNQLQPVSWWIILNSSELNAQVGYTDRLSPVYLYVCKHFQIFFFRTTGAYFNKTWQKSILGDKDKGLKEGHTPFQEGSMRNSQNTLTIIFFSWTIGLLQPNLTQIILWFRELKFVQFFFKERYLRNSDNTLRTFKNLLLQNQGGNFNPTKYNSFLSKGDSSLFKWMTTPFSKGSFQWNSEKNFNLLPQNLLPHFNKFQKSSSGDSRFFLIEGKIHVLTKIVKIHWPQLKSCFHQNNDPNFRYTWHKLSSKKGIQICTNIKGLFNSKKGELYQLFLTSERCGLNFHRWWK